LNYDVMRQNVLDEIQKPQKEPHQTQVVKTYQIVRDAKTYDLYTYPDYKRYQLVYDKRVIDPSTFQIYPYGYQATYWLIACRTKLMEKKPNSMGRR